MVKPGSVLVLVARSSDDLRALQTELAESEEGRAGLVVECVVADLSQMEGMESVVRASKDALSADIDHIILVNNAGKKTTCRANYCARVSDWPRRKAGFLCNTAANFIDPVNLKVYLAGI